MNTTKFKVGEIIISKDGRHIFTVRSDGSCYVFEERPAETYPTEHIERDLVDYYSIQGCWSRL